MGKANKNHKTINNNNNNVDKIVHNTKETLNVTHQSFGQTMKIMGIKERGKRARNYKQKKCVLWRILYNLYLGDLNQNISIRF